MAHVTHVAPCHLPIADGTVDPRLAKPPLTLACEKCRMPDSEEWMLLCDACGVGWHTFCLKPPLESVPDGTWVCPGCTKKGVTAQQIDALAVQASGSPLQPPPWLVKYQGAFAMRPAQGRRARSKGNVGTVTYAGKRRNVHSFTIEYPDRTSELVSLKELRPRLVDGSKEPAAATTHAAERDKEAARHSAHRRAEPVATAEECAALAEFINLSASVSVYAPLGISGNAATWVRRQGCSLRRGGESAGPEAASAQELEKANRNGVDMGVVWLEVGDRAAISMLDVASARAREAAVARVSLSFVREGEPQRLAWLRRKEAAGELLMVPCTTCLWIVIMARGARRQGFLKREPQPIVVF